MKPSLFIFLFVLFLSSLTAQKYAVYFTDKNSSPYNIDNPEVFLSQRAIERRERHNIQVTVQDLPVNPQYVSVLKSMGAKVPFTSRWLNCALVSCSSTVINQIVLLDFVSHYIYISPGNFSGKSGDGDPDKLTSKLEREENFEEGNSRDIDETYNYGQGYTQINQINGIPVHLQGFTGEGVLIAVLDAGFTNVNTLPVFSNLFTEGRLVFAKDIVVPNGNIYNNTHSHGTNVLSCMSAYSNNSFVGTAPKASFALIRTEEDPGEYLIECYNWVVGVELADSIGADIVNSSLGYTTFDDPSMNYTYSQMDGETPVASFAAKCAIEKGIFVSVSNGNNNGTSWPWMGSPGDTKYAASIGAVNSNGDIASFSSLGPNGIGDPKPNVCALGVNSTVYSTSGSISLASGTSFSSPISCGMYACLIQANPKIHPKNLRDIVDETGDRFPNHDVAYGYGIPDFASALETVIALGAMEIIDVTVDDSQGNNDGKLNPGETVNLQISIINKTSEIINNVNAVASTSNPDVTFINHTANFGTFLPDEIKIIPNAFTFTLSENANPKTTIKFSVAISYDSKILQGFFSLDIFGNILDFKAYAVDDFYGNANGLLDPGETADLYVYILNNGNEIAKNVTGILTSSSSEVSIHTPIANFGTLNASQTKFAPFSVTVSDNAVQGDISIPFLLQLTDSEGKTKNVGFTYKDKCNVIFELHDSYGDGWNNAAIKVSFDNGMPTQTLTIPNGSFATYSINVPVKVNVTLFWQVGGYDSECSFVVKYESGEIIYNGFSAPPFAGVFYSFVNRCGSCNPPPAHATQYAVHFKNKTNSPYSIDKPLEFLSQKALDRRTKYGISITEEDFPVNPDYIETVNATGAIVSTSSRWSNSVLVYAEEDMLNAIEQLNIVEKTVLVKPTEGTYRKFSLHPKWSNNTLDITAHPKNDYDYGYAQAQIKQLNGIFVHKKGYTGEGVLVAVLDGGFKNSNNVAGFKHLFESDRIVYKANIVDKNVSVYDVQSGHGTSVLSCMGGFIPGEYVGTAPSASFALIVTEDVLTEYPIEEYFWMIGAEKADSIGADIINSSLGYTTFDDTLMNHKYSDLDGKTIISSIAAKMAVERGVFVTNSAGNSNGKPFPWVGSPADAQETLALAAVNLEGEIAAFSSLGYNGAGYSKPDVAACGWQAAVINSENIIGLSYGTSYASPITCGLVACVIQAAPQKKPHEIMEAIHKSANRYPNHDVRYGYGIPDFGKVLQLLDVLPVDEISENANLKCYPNPVNNFLFLSNPDKMIRNVELYDIAGKLIRNVMVEANQTSIEVNEMGIGFIFVKVVYEDGGSETAKCIKY
ncbi:MAG: S8 family serine peptidase [Bacteroidales bacterium]|jgi:hypothetical protein|nr:S8 family serine peptidase [Bacteroidales bacterium]